MIFSHSYGIIYLFCGELPQAKGHDVMELTERTKRTDPRRYYQGQPGCENVIVQIAGVNVLVWAPTGENGKYLFLLQERSDGFYGAIGGAIDLFVNSKNQVVDFEGYEIALAREFREETGHDLLEQPGTWLFLDFVMSQVDYPRHPSVHGASLYFSTQSTPQRIQRYASGGSKEGNIVILDTTQVLQALQAGKVSPNTEPALRKLLQNWCILPVEG